MTPATRAAPCVPCQIPHQERGADAREDEPREKHDVVDQNPAHAHPQEGSGDDGRREQRFRIGERPALGGEDIPVEQMRRRERQLVRNPAQRPQVQERIARVVHGVLHMPHLRVRHHGGQHREQQRRCESETLWTGARPAEAPRRPAARCRARRAPSTPLTVSIRRAGAGDPDRLESPVRRRDGGDQSRPPRTAPGRPRSPRSARRRGGSEIPLSGRR